MSLSLLGVGFFHIPYMSAQLLTFVANAATITPAITLSAGAPTPVWRVTEANGAPYFYTTAGFTHNRVAAGNMRVELMNTRKIGAFITQIDCNGDGLTGTWGVGQLKLTPKLQQLRLYGNASLNCNFRLADLPTGMTYLYLATTSSVITGTLADLPAGMTQLYLNSTSSVITGTLADLPAGMTTLYLYSTSSTITGALSDLPAGMTQLLLNSTSSTITGTLADLPAGMTILYLNSTSSVITGALADLPATMTYLRLNSTSSVITGGAGPMAAVSIREISINDCALNQATIDDVVLRVWTDKPLFTYALPGLNIGGTNANPSGAYQAVCPPTSGLERVYDLVNGNCTPAGSEWNVVY